MALSVRVVLVQPGMEVQGGAQVTTRQSITPVQPTCVLQFPYRKWLQQLRRLLQLPWAQPQPHSTHRLQST